MPAVEAPCTCAARMNSLLRMVSASARAMRAYGDHVVSAMARIAFSSPGPRAATSASARIRRGKARKTSVIRISTLSTTPPTYPATVPTSRPTGTTMIPTSPTM